MNSDLVKCAIQLDNADSPEVFERALFAFLDIVSLQAAIAAHECESNWQDPAAGKPWSKIAQRLNRMIDNVAFGGKIHA